MTAIQSHRFADKKKKAEALLLPVLMDLQQINHALSKNGLPSCMSHSFLCINPVENDSFYGVSSHHYQPLPRWAQEAAAGCGEEEEWRISALSSSQGSAVLVYCTALEGLHNNNNQPTDFWALGLKQWRKFTPNYILPSPWAQINSPSAEDNNARCMTSRYVYFSNEV